jgi:hypothetical protein
MLRHRFIQQDHVDVVVMLVCCGAFSWHLRLRSTRPISQ